MRVVRRCLANLLERVSPRARIVSLGAGLDAEMARLAGRAEVVEVDVPEVAARKKALLEELGVSGVEVVGLDLRDDEDEDGLARLFDDRTIVFSECCLAYVPPEVAAKARRIAAKKSAAAWLELSPAPKGAYGAALAEGFQRRGAPLLSAPASPEAAAADLLRHDWPAALARTLDAAAIDIEPLYEGELFDEHAALAVARRHYVVAVASKDPALLDACFRPRVRPFEPDDLDQVRKCYENAMLPAEHSIAKHARAALRGPLSSAEAVAKTFARFWVAVEGGVVGCVGLDASKSIKNLAVVPEARRRGVASALLDAAEGAGGSHLDTLGGLTGAVRLFEKRGFELAKVRSVRGKSGAFELRSYRKLVDLVALPLVEADHSEPRLKIPHVKPLDAHVDFQLPAPLYVSLVFQLGGRRYVAKRTSTSPHHNRTIPKGAFVRCRLEPTAPPEWAFPRRINTFRRRRDDPCGAGEEGPCTCNADCLVA
ncbi:hypothetical protein CTAYLR_006543 [Chrysophaeum taylorii]|uniref:[phosphatase 2A protein]-leucine-carboxy methyltransferase n=1 Tax=Chrysophaeum taylorii TaxID=2483200 RepID=A0AAD7XLK0_9STRA|nr:hypothetical protein CTAYLR_006543 [Chrysophaeum taylorii]